MNRSLVSSLADLVGSDAAGRFATAYEAVVLGVSLGQLHRMPDRETRAAIFDAMLTEGRRSGYAVDRLTEAGAAAARQSMAALPASP